MAGSPFPAVLAVILVCIVGAIVSRVGRGGKTEISFGYGALNVVGAAVGILSGFNAVSRLSVDSTPDGSAMALMFGTVSVQLLVKSFRANALTSEGVRVLGYVHRWIDIERHDWLGGSTLCIYKKQRRFLGNRRVRVAVPEHISRERVEEILRSHLEA